MSPMPKRDAGTTLPLPFKTVAPSPAVVSNDVAQPHDGVSLVVPRLFAEEGPNAAKHFVEFFVAQLRNENTRTAYARATKRFCSWCDEQGVSLGDVDPFVASAYVEAFSKERPASTVKQHLAALRMLCDWLVTRRVMMFNPFSSVRGPRLVVDVGKTPTLFEDDARAFMESIDTSHVVGLRDKAILAVMLYSFARVSAVVTMRVMDYQSQGRKAFFALEEKGGKFLRVPVHHKAADILDAYIEAAGIRSQTKQPLFRTTRGRARELTDRTMSRSDVLRMVKRRAVDAGLDPSVVTNHTFRASGITNYMENGGSLEVAAQLAGHASTKTTQLYNRHREQVGQDEIERIRI